MIGEPPSLAGTLHDSVAELPEAVTFAAFGAVEVVAAIAGAATSTDPESIVATIATLHQRRMVAPTVARARIAAGADRMGA